MKFNEFISFWDVACSFNRKQGLPITRTADEYILELCKHCMSIGNVNDGIWAVTEQQWRKELKPFYNVWPCIGEALANTSLDLSCTHFVTGHANLIATHQVSVVLLRWPEGQEFDGVVKSCLVSIRYVPPISEEGRQVAKEYNLSPDSINSSTEMNVELWVRIDAEREIINGITTPIYWDRNFRLYPDKTLLESFTVASQEVPSELSEAECKTTDRVLHIVGAVLLMAGNKDPCELISPVVLNADRDKYDLNKDTKYISKAKKRGVVGWDIGKNIEFSPHMRRPHFGLRWTEKGRTVPKIVPIKGCIVRRNKLTDVPTGFLSKEEA